MARESKIRATKSDRVFNAVTYIIMTIIFLMVAYPLYFVIIASFSEPSRVATGSVVFYPVGLNLEGYKAVFREKEIVRGFLNSILYTVVGTSVNLIVTVPAAYAMSRPLKGRKWIMTIFMIPMFISGGLVPTYLVVRQLKLINSMWALILPAGISIYNMIIARTFFQTNLPEELMDAGKIDGCSNTRFFIKIAIPLSKAIIAILVLYYGVGHWNSYFSAMIYLNDKDKFPLQLVLRTILMQNQKKSQMVQNVEELQRQQQIAEVMKYSLIIISSLPVIILYPFIQKYFVKGVMIGSLKG